MALFDHHHQAPASPPAVHGGDAPAGGAAKPKGKLAAHKETIIVIASVVGVILAWVTYRSIKGGASSSTTASQPVTSTGTVANADVASEQQQDQAIAGFQTMLGNMGNELDTIQSTVTQNTADITGLQTPGNTITTPVPGTPSPNVAAYQGDTNSIGLLLKNFFNHDGPSNIYAADEQGASRVLSAINSNNTAAQNQQQAQLVITGYQAHNQTGLYTGQIAGAQQALARIK